MRFRWRDFERVGQLLDRLDLSDPADTTWHESDSDTISEAVYRSIIGRMYYAAFQPTLGFVREQDQDPILLYKFAGEVVTYRNDRVAARTIREAAKKNYGKQAQKFIEDLPIVAKDLKVHGYVRQAILNPISPTKQNKERAAVSEALNRMREKRNMSDYDQLASVSKGDVEFVKAEAKVVFDNLKKLGANM